MKMTTMKNSLLGLLFSIALLGAGCNSMEDAGDEVGDAAESAADAVGDGLDNVGDAAEDAVN
jgi:predicted small secreted protein